MFKFPETKLRDYQGETVRQAREFFRQGKKRLVIMLATASGKTVISTHMIKQAAAKGLRCGFVCDRIELINQTSARLDMEGVSHGVIQGDHPRYDPAEQVQVCSIQTLARRKTKQFDLIIVDECFDGETLVQTVSGPKPIKLVHSGDMVYNALGVGEVISVSARPLGERKLFNVRFSDGTQSRCTGEHRFFTGGSWVQTRELEGKSVVSFQDLSCVRGCVQAMGETGERREDEHTVTKTVGCANVLLEVLLEEADKPHVFREGQGKTVGHTQKNRTQAAGARGKRHGDDKTTRGITQGAGTGVGCGTCGENPPKSSRRVSPSLQGGYSKSEKDDCYRGGREVAQLVIKKGARCEKNCAIGEIRVVSVQAEECSRTTVVYNLGVSGHPSYFANGKLVHNCQTFHTAHKRLMADNEGSFIIGLSATPFTKGLGKHFDGLISPVTAKQLIAQGHLVGFKVFGPRTIDVTGIKIVAGDYDQTELGERADKPKIVADIVKTWLEKGGNRQTICFATNVAHSKHIVREFQKAGVLAEHIDSFTDKDTRAAVLRRLANFETRIVSCVDILTKGFDCPVVSCIIQALPTKSLMRHIQQIGRGLRTSQGKTECCILDHAGNHERLGFIDDIEFTELDDGKKKEASSKKAKDKPEKLPLVCPSCDYMKPAGVRKCPACGLIAEHIADVETEEGELREVKRNRKGYTLAQKQAFLAGLNSYAVEKGFRIGRGGVYGWSLHKYKDFFGCDPCSKIEWGARGPIGEDVRKFITHVNIKWAKSKERKPESALSGWQND